jgi:hypothetical protein
MSTSHKLCALVLGLAAIDLAAQTPAPQPTSLPGSSPHVYKTIGDTELRLHVFSPAGERTASLRPAIIFSSVEAGSPARSSSSCRSPNTWPSAA